MIHSMTGYAAAQLDLGHAVLHLELKSVNSRFLDIGFRCGDEVRFLEMPLREKIAAAVARGKLECRVNLLAQATASRERAPNRAAMLQLGEMERMVREALPDAAPLTVAEVLRWPGVLAEEGMDQERLQAECLALADAVIADFLASRAREGVRLAEVLLERASRMHAHVAEVTPILPRVLADYEARLAAKLREVLGGQEEERIRQEMGLFAARIDVAEELARLTTHLAEVERVIGKGGAVGKRLDFLMQELNREANTLASKSVSAELTAIALELKLLIEQMREQVQNLE
jgi:uncharacterized protein (TIGR00255 family)